MTVPELKLNNGNSIRRVGLGLWKIKDQREFNTAFDAAISAGYRHFDTAQAYENESFLGEALLKSRLKREDIFITTKIAVEHFGHRRARQTFEESLSRLETNYVDLLLLHFPVPVLRKRT